MPGRPATARPDAAMAAYAVGCLGLALGILFVALPRGFAPGGVPLGLPVQAGLMGLAFAVGAWGAFSAKEGRVFLASVAALALLAPAYDPRAPLERLAAYLAAAVLVLLFVEFSLLHAKVAKLAQLPRAHVTQVGRTREVELSATARRIAASWPTPLAIALALIGLGMAVQLGLAALAPPAVGESVEWRGPFGLVLGTGLVFAVVGAVAARRVKPQEPEGGSRPGGSSAGGDAGGPGS